MKILDSVLTFFGLVRYSQHRKEMDEVQNELAQKYMFALSDNVSFSYTMHKFFTAEQKEPMYRFLIQQEFKDQTLHNNLVRTLYTDDYEYGVLCAQELCDKLNESI